MPKFLAPIVFAVMVAVFSPGAMSTSYVYADTTDFSSSIAIDTTTREGAIGDRGASVELCAGKEPFRCFELEGMVFAIPKKFDSRSQRLSWEFRDHKFNASKAHGVKILGKTYDAYFIDSTSQTAPIRFLYSTQYGLIAIKGLGTQQDRVFMLQSACGFASSHQCK